jgi:thiamine-phosphate pyrophosphorylase
MLRPVTLISEHSLGAARLLAALDDVFSHCDGRRLTVVDRWPDDAAAGPRLAHLQALRALTAAAGAQLIVKGRGDLALAVGADGLHLGERSITTADARRFGLPTGRACHDLSGLIACQADWALLSPVAAPISKAATSAPLGVAGFGNLLSALELLSYPLPVYALGGVAVELVGPLRAAGAAGIAVIGSVLLAARPGRAAAELLAAWDAAEPELPRLG